MSVTYVIYEGTQISQIIKGDGQSVTETFRDLPEGTVYLQCESEVVGFHDAPAYDAEKVQTK